MDRLPATAAPLGGMAAALFPHGFLWIPARHRLSAAVPPS